MLFVFSKTIIINKIVINIYQNKISKYSLNILLIKCWNITKTLYNSKNITVYLKSLYLI